MNTSPISLRYVEKVTVGHSNGCWGWSGSRDSHGYGQMWCNGRVQPAHRVSWALVNGSIPDGACILHRCDNPPCTNPDHLFLGTKKDNMMDAAQKRRVATRPKLSPPQAIEIRNSEDRGVDLASRYGVSQATVSMIRSGRRWASPEV